ncbi:glycosyltransferase [Rhodopila globiformis]|uniref:Glycosyltransferase 2-like domain-containing protein n=1 Tax=Rhodopila globiformis TaxID=1071 RepID=A0A2S6NN88_RHOGL|nr:glycosyltransferase [Rhodopila globiformis]PPQ38315.1 hypothetical protein CCS01_02500 [Rhodopila globiformis]
MWDWNIAVFCRNEQASIARCIESLTHASRGRRALITLIVNGSTDDSAETALAAAERSGMPILIYAIAYADKANAINQFFYELRQPAKHYFFVDAYVKIGPRALRELESCLATRPDIAAATGIGVNGRTMYRNAQTTLTQGGHLHGQLHTLRADFINRLVASKIRLPIKLYRGDGLLGSMVIHNLDPLHTPWEPKRIGSSPGATYEIPATSIFRPSDLRRQFHREIRQQRGHLENAAIKSIIYEKGYEGLPSSASDMILAYIERFGLPRVPLADRPFQALALRHLRRAQRPEPAQLQPRLLSSLNTEPADEQQLQLFPA